MNNRTLRPVNLILWMSQLILPGTILIYAIQLFMRHLQQTRLLNWAVLFSLLWVTMVILFLSTARGCQLVNRYAAKWFIFLASLLISIVVTEGFLRLSFYHSLVLPTKYSWTSLKEPHRERGWSLLPNRSTFFETRDYAVHERTNSKGLRDVEHSYIPDPEVFRIIVLGDSYMEAYQVEFEESLPCLLQQNLAHQNVEVINFGISGYGTTQELIYLKEEGLKYKPDLVVLAFAPQNDLRNNSRELEALLWGEETIKTFGRPFAKIDRSTEKLVYVKPDFERSKRWVVQQRATMRKLARQRSMRDRLIISKLFVDNLRPLLNRKYEKLQWDPNIFLGSYLETFDPESGSGDISIKQYESKWNDAWKVGERLILEMNNLAKNNGAEFVLMMVAEVWQADQRVFGKLKKQYPRLEFDMTKPNRRILDFCRTNKIRVLDLVPSFREVISSNEQLLFHQIEDFHWNAAGHHVATDSLVQYLELNKLLVIPNDG